VAHDCFSSFPHIKATCK